jgi:arylsulfatase
LSRAYEFDRGFDSFDDSLPLARNRVITLLHRVLNYVRLQPYKRANDLTDQGLKWFDNTDGQRFLWLHYMDPHGPYQPPAEYQQLFRENTVGKREAKRLWRRTVDEPQTLDRSDRDQLVDLYDAEIRYLDEHVSRFFDGLAKRDLLNDTFIIIAADHGDSFGEHGIYGHPRCLYETLIHVPLLVRPPGGADGIRIKSPVENIDIAPTLLEGAGRSSPSSFSGSPLPTDDADNSGLAFAHARGENDDTGLNRYAVRTAKNKLHLQIDKDGVTHSRELYDLTDNGSETVPVENDRVEIRERLERVLSMHLKSIDRADGCSDEPVDDVVQDRLEMLGYRE